MNFEERKKRFLDILMEIAEIINKNSNLINFEKISSLIDLIVKTYGKNRMVFLYGAGRSGFIGRCFAQRLMHLGIKSCFISDAVTHRYNDNDLLIIISGSGETTSPLAIAEKAKEMGGTLVLFTGNPYSNIAKLSDLIIQIEGKSKEKAIIEDSLAPYTTLFDISTLAVLDAVGGVLMKILGVSEADIDKRHASIE
ncbi:MAG: SIS domain-containing protein [Promethearchaeota archaeon]|jgi:6-phospho-3-hexuloisomerase